MSNEPLINSRIGGENQLVFLNRTKLDGIQSLSIQQNPGLNPLTYAGIGNKTLNYIPITEQSSTVSINRTLIDNEPFLQFVTGNTLANLYILREQSDLINNYILTSGYFNSFNCSYSIGNTANCSVNFISLGNAGKINTGNLNLDNAQDLNFISTGNFVKTGSYLIPSIGTISLNIDTFNQNRLQSFNISIESNKIPVYCCGSKLPKRIDNFSSNIDVGFSFALGTHEIPSLRNFPQSGIVKNLSITINDYSTNANICQFNFNNLNLISENYSIEQNDTVLIEQVYQTKIFHN